MEIFKGVEKYADPGQKTALAIGNFDGVHLGHQKILRTLTHLAETHNLISSVLTFDPHPDKYFHRPGFYHIQTLGQRLEKMEELGVRQAVVAVFDRHLAEMKPEEFIRRIIKNVFRAETVIVGENFRFGYSRSGNVSLLKKKCFSEGFSVVAVPPVTVRARKVSSSLVRELLLEGKVGRARLFLGRCYELEGAVGRGSLRGQSIGYPTANLITENEILPIGVFLTQAWVSGRFFDSLTNIGSCPTFSKKGLHIETHLLDFKGDLYGKRMKLLFLKKIRDEKKFPSPEELALQINRDLERAKRYFLSAGVKKGQKISVMRPKK